jgi:hypothetical protein
MHRAGLFPGAARCVIMWPDAALNRISRGRLLHAKAAPLQSLDAAHPLAFFELFAPFRGYSFFLGKPAANGTSAFSQFAKLSFTDSGDISAIRLV